MSEAAAAATDCLISRLRRRIAPPLPSAADPVAGSLTGVFVEKEVSAPPVFFEDDASAIDGSPTAFTVLWSFPLGRSRKSEVGGGEAILQRLRPLL